MSVLAIIQARLGSERLPRKTMMDICCQPMIERVIERVREIRGVDDIVVAVPLADADEFAAHTDYCGVDLVAADVPENDVLARFAIVALQYLDADTIVRVTGDCPLLDPRVAEDVLALYRECHAWYAWNVYPGYCDGEDLEVFRREALFRAHDTAVLSSDREHVTSWIRRNYPVVTLKPTDPGRRKTSVDTLEDLEYVRELYEDILDAEDGGRYGRGCT